MYVAHGNQKKIFYLQQDLSFMPFLLKAMDPKEITLNYEDFVKMNDDFTKQEDKSEHNSQLSVAHETICNKCVSLTNKVCWVVIGTDSVTSYAVHLFPKETYSCSAVKMCYHLMACKLKIGQSPECFTNAKPNMTLLGLKTRKKNKEGPSGRKHTRQRILKSYLMAKQMVSYTHNS